MTTIQFYSRFLLVFIFHVTTKCLHVTAVTSPDTLLTFFLICKRKDNLLILDDVNRDLLGDKIAWILVKYYILQLMSVQQYCTYTCTTCYAVNAGDMRNSKLEFELLLVSTPSVLSQRTFFVPSQICFTYVENPFPPSMLHISTDSKKN